MIKIKMLLTGILLAGCASIKAQSDTKRFRKAFKENIEELLAVYNFRGASFVCNYREDAAYEQVVFQFLQHWDSAAQKPALLFYSKTRDSLFIWMFEQGNMHAHAQVITDDSLIRLERELRESLRVENTRGLSEEEKTRGTNLALKEGKKKSWEPATAALTRVLLPMELRPYLSGKGHLFVLPELNIGQIPFWVLQPFGNGSFLVDSMSFSLVPHVCKFEEFAQHNDSLGYFRALKFNKPLVVGNPKYDPGLNLSDLPGARTEAIAVADILHCEALTGNEALLSVVKSKFRHADLIYLATHASCSMEDILRKSWIAFTPDGDYNRGLLTLYDVQRMMINCRLAVLSACQTGYGQVLEGGFVGLGRAFFKAGVDFTVVSLWSVNDEATSYLMSHFMQHTLGPSAYQPAQPLRRAILETKTMYPHPALWAPFVLFGFTY
jgi:CHAT domain-containing protein